jgi:hypothetical protein
MSQSDKLRSSRRLAKRRNEDRTAEPDAEASTQPAKQRKFSREPQNPKHIRRHLTAYKGTCKRYRDLLDTSPYQSDESRGRINHPGVAQTTQELSDLQTMISDFSRKLERQMASLQDSCKGLEHVARENSNWWNHVNIFSPSKLNRSPDGAKFNRWQHYLMYTCDCWTMTLPRMLQNGPSISYNAST